MEEGGLGKREVRKHRSRSVTLRQSEKGAAFVLVENDSNVLMVAANESLLTLSSRNSLRGSNVAETREDDL